MEKNPMKNDARRARHGRRLGEDPVCILCGESAPDVLDPLRKEFLDRHHVLGKAYDEGLTVVVCPNCHRKLSNGQQDRGLDLLHEQKRNLLGVIAAILSEAGVFLSELGERFEQWSIRILNLVAALDTQFPPWRKMAEAQI